MKFFVFIMLNFLLLFSSSEKSNEPKAVKTFSKDAVMAQDVQSFFSANPSSQKRNKVEFWEERIFVPNLK